MKTLTPLYALLALLAASPSAAVNATDKEAVKLPKPERGGVPENALYDYGVMGPPATPAIVAAAQTAISARMAQGPVAPRWESIAQHYKTPAWFMDAKFGIFMHWGVYAVPAYQSEWYEKHMYGPKLAWHTEHFGAPESFGYKDFIPLFTQAKFNPDEWAALFKRAGARLVMPTAQHHDNFALWDSQVTPFNAVKMGPKRDLIGALGVSVRKLGLKYGVSNHGVENFSFIEAPQSLLDRLRAKKADLYDPVWRDFYNVADRSDAAMSRFLADWVNRNVELIDKYQPDILWFDNGANLRVLDPLKLQVAAHYYNRAQGWGKDVSISTKFVAYAPDNDTRHQVGSILDFEKVGKRSPTEILAQPWMVDDVIGSTWGYTDGMSVSSSSVLIGRLIDTVSKGGFYLLNISPRADGLIPDEQQRVLLEIGEWLALNGEAIYGSRPWIRFGEANWYFTSKDGAVYAIGSDANANIASLGTAVRKVKRVEQLGAGPVTFVQDQHGLRIEALSLNRPRKVPLVFKVM